MDILVISGFLGSGKTTLLLSLAKGLAESSGRKIAIVENEVGKVGVDGQILEAEGFPVKELFSGCICCSLRIDLVNTLLELERTAAPDIVIIEPSGVAGPDQILAALVGYGGEIGRKVIINIVDASRHRIILSKPLLPIVSKGIEVADLILLSKADTVTGDDLQFIEDEIRALRPDANVISISAVDGRGMENLPQLVEVSLSPLEPGTYLKTDAATENSYSDAAVFSEKFKYSIDTGIGADALSGKISRALEELARKLHEAGCKMIGHVKIVVRDEDKAGYLLLSITDFEAVPAAKGRLSGKLRKFTVTINAIAYGIDQLSLSMLARKAVSEII